MNRREHVRERLQTRHRVGTFTGYGGLFLGLMALLTTTSEGTPFARGEAAWVVFAFMIGGYLFGWLLGPALSRLLGQSN